MKAMPLLQLLCLYLTIVQADTSCIANSQNEFHFRINHHSPGITGAYLVEGCNGNNPVLQIKRGIEYTFVQHDESNWMHPIGFAYYPDGAHGFGKFAEVPELEQPTPGDCNLPEFKCNPGTGVRQAPLYGIDGVFETYDDWNNGATSGLDVYEPQFKRPKDQWSEHKYAIRLTVPVESKTKEFFYFCHLHSGMSGLIQVVDHATNANPLIQPFDPDTYYVEENAFDKQCGTSGVAKYKDTSKYCPGMTFLCGISKNKVFSKCMRAIDCHMHYEMKVKENDNSLVTFMHQMIPHHLNAVNMARIALKLAAESPGYDDDSDLNVPELLTTIINTQNLQIQEMEKWLKKHGPKAEYCGHKKNCKDASRYCSLWASFNYCRWYKNFMQKNCPNSCNIC